MGLALKVLAVLVGPWLAAVAGSVLLIVAGMRWWARLEARMFAPPRPSAQAVMTRRLAPAVDDDGHLAFAQALADVAVRYLAECQAENSR